MCQVTGKPRGQEARDDVERAGHEPKGSDGAGQESVARLSGSVPSLLVWDSGYFSGRVPGGLGGRGRPVVGYYNGFMPFA